MRVRPARQHWSEQVQQLRRKLSPWASLCCHDELFHQMRCAARSPSGTTARGRILSPKVDETFKYRKLSARPERPLVSEINALIETHPNYRQLRTPRGLNHLLLLTIGLKSPLRSVSGFVREPEYRYRYPRSPRESIR